MRASRAGEDVKDITGFSAFKIRFRLYPWIEDDLDSKLDEMFQRLRNTVCVMRNVWRQTGLWKYLSEERPAQWTQGPVPAGGGADPTLPAADPLKKARKTAWQRAGAERNSAAAVMSV
eukprot:3936667-Rhodomonas_salina.2